MADRPRTTNTFAETLKALPGYPWLPCPICHGVEGCDHCYAERAKAAIPGLHFTENRDV